jgi:hypothetical protein
LRGLLRRSFRPAILGSAVARSRQICAIAARLLQFVPRKDAGEESGGFAEFTTHPTSPIIVFGGKFLTL